MGQAKRLKELEKENSRLKGSSAAPLRCTRSVGCGGLQRTERTHPSLPFGTPSCGSLRFKSDSRT